MPPRREIETLERGAGASKLHGATTWCFVDLRDIRELDREGRIPGAFHCPRGMLEFWIDPQSPYHKPIFAEDKRFVFFCACRLALGAGDADGAAHGAEAGRSHRRRLRRLEEGGRAGRAPETTTA